MMEMLPSALVLPRTVTNSQSKPNIGELEVTWHNWNKEDYNYVASVVITSGVEM